MTPLALGQQSIYQIPAAVTIAQAIIESSWGASVLVSRANNYFGIQYAQTQGAANYGEFDVESWEMVNGQRVDQMEEFQKFASARDSFTHHSLLLMRPRYRAAYAVRGDWQKFAAALGPKVSPLDSEHCGYSTNPGYAALISELVREFGLDNPRALAWFAEGADPQMAPISPMEKSA